MGWIGYLEEANTGKGMKMRNNKGMKVYLGIVLPVLVLIVMILGLI